MLPATSRYFGIETATLTTSDGREIPYLRRRFIPQAPITVLAEHVVTQGDRLDNVTARYLGDPEQFWRVCDANRAFRAEDLEQDLGRRLLIPLPGGA